MAALRNFDSTRRELERVASGAQRRASRSGIYNSLLARRGALLKAGAMAGSLPEILPSHSDGDLARFDDQLKALESRGMAAPARATAPTASRSSEPILAGSRAPAETSKGEKRAAIADIVRRRTAGEITGDQARSEVTAAGRKTTVQGPKLAYKGSPEREAVMKDRAQAADTRPPEEKAADSMRTQMQRSGIVGEGARMRKTGAGYEVEVPSQSGRRFVGVQPSVDESMNVRTNGDWASMTPAQRGQKLRDTVPNNQRGRTIESPQPYQSAFVANSGDVLNKDGMSTGRALATRYGSGSSTFATPQLPAGDRQLVNDPALDAATSKRRSYLATVSGAQPAGAKPAGGAPSPVTPLAANPAVSNVAGGAIAASQTAPGGTNIPGEAGQNGLAKRTAEITNPRNSATQGAGSLNTVMSAEQNWQPKPPDQKRRSIY